MHDCAASTTVLTEQSLVALNLESPAFTSTIVELRNSKDGSTEQLEFSSTQAAELASLKWLLAEKDDEVESLRKQLHDKEQLLADVETTVTTLKGKLIEVRNHNILVTKSSIAINDKVSYIYLTFQAKTVW